jgi:hypothetical protein
MMSTWKRWLSVGMLALGGCGDPGLDNPEGADPDEITGANAVARTITLKGYVLVEPGASASTILETVRQQTRTFFGPLRNDLVGLDDREVRNVDPATFVREPVTVVDTDDPMAATRMMLRVRYTYTGRAVLDRSLSSRRSLSTVALMGNWASNGREILQACVADSHDRELGASNLWYTFDPDHCRSMIDREVRAIDAATRKLTDRRTQVSALEAARRFLPTTATLATIRSNVTRYPEYDRLLGASDPSKTDLHVYAFFGVIGERESNPRDDGYVEMMYVLRNILRAQPGARFEAPSGTGSLTDLRVGGTMVPGATERQVVEWALGASAPSGVTSTALRQAILDVWKTRTINLTVPMTVTSGGRSHPLNVRVHTYYGDEGSAWSASARARYIDAWRNADVFIYSGHSHLGSGPLDPGNFTMSDFPNRYQIMMVNSCVSYNYYNTGFHRLHPGGTRNLDMVVNGLEALSDNGHAVSNLITSLIAGQGLSWGQVLRRMVATVPELGLYDYDPLRVVDGETDNTYTPSSRPLTLTPAATSR